MLTLFIEAFMLRRNMLVLFAGRLYRVDHLSQSSNVVYVELLPAYGPRMRTAHMQIHMHTPMEVHIPLM